MSSAEDTLLEVDNIIRGGAPTDTSGEGSSNFEFKDPFDLDDYEVELERSSGSRSDDVGVAAADRQQQQTSYEEQQTYDNVFSNDPPTPEPTNNVGGFSFNDGYKIQSTTPTQIRYAFFKIEFKKDPTISEVLKELNLDASQITEDQVQDILKCSKSFAEVKYNNNNDMRLVGVVLQMAEALLVTLDDENGEEIKEELTVIRESIQACDRDKMLYDALHTEVPITTPMQKAVKAMLYPVLSMGFRKLPSLIAKAKGMLSNGKKQNLKRTAEMADIRD